MANLTSQEITALIAKIKKFPYLCSIGSTNIGPLAGAPTVEPDTETTDVTLYETGADAGISHFIEHMVRDAHAPDAQRGRCHDAHRSPHKGE